MKHPIPVFLKMFDTMSAIWLYIPVNYLGFGFPRQLLGVAMIFRADKYRLIILYEKEARQLFQAYDRI